MKLRHVLLLACAIGASGALLLAWDMHKRLKDAESALLLKGVVGAPQPRQAGDGARGSAVSFTLQPDEPTLSMLTIHALGLLSLAFLFLAIFLLLLSALREQAFALALGGESPDKRVATPSTMPRPAPHPTLSPVGRGEGEGDAIPVVMLLAEAAQLEEATAARMEETGAAVSTAGVPPAQSEAGEKPAERAAAVPAEQAGETPALQPPEE